MVAVLEDLAVAQGAEEDVLAHDHVALHKPERMKGDNISDEARGSVVNGHEHKQWGNKWQSGVEAP